jgi:subtilase family serine protease
MVKMPRRRSVLLATIACAAIAAAAAFLPSAFTSGSSTKAAIVKTSPGDTTIGSARTAAPPTEAQCQAKYSAPCYGPIQIEEAYGTPKLYAKGIEGQGQTIVIVDSFGSPTIASDLAVFDQAYGLPAPPSFKIIQPAGSYTWTGNDDQQGWAGETTLDVEYAHAIAPKAKILLVETPVSETEGVTGFPQIVKAEEYVIAHHLGGVITQSFNATEQTFTTKQSLLALRGAYTDAYSHDVTVLAASGDNGATDSELNENLSYPYPTVGWPASDPLVTAVGGTQLSLNAKGDRTSPDIGWSDSGGGVSTIFSRPAYQDSVAKTVGTKRGVPDISMSASCDGAVLTYASFTGTGKWGLTCGTSEATPLFGGIVALSDQVAHHWLGLINPAIYELEASHAPGIVDITGGNNGQTLTQNGGTYTVKGYSATPGYNLVTGAGTVYAPDFVYELAEARR